MRVTSPCRSSIVSVNQLIETSKFKFSAPAELGDRDFIQEETTTYLRIKTKAATVLFLGLETLKRLV